MSTRLAPCLFWASLNGHTGLVRILIYAGADVDARFQFRYTALLAGVESDHPVPIAKLLIAAGADVNAHADPGFTALHCAASRGRLELTQMLIDAGANVDSMPSVGGRFYGERSTPLHEAIRGGHSRVAALLIAAGAALNVRDSAGCTPLHYAVRLGHAEAAKILLDAGADVDAEAGNRGATPLWLACSAKRDDLAKLLRAYGGSEHC
jgi:uncharacterized protein